MLRFISRQRSLTGWTMCGFVFATALALTSAPGADIPALWNGSSGNWTDATRWSTNPIFPNNNPPNLYDAVIAAGSVTLNQNIGINLLTLSGALTGSAGLTLAEGIAWNGGNLALTGPGRVNLGAGSSSSVSGVATFTSGRIVGGGNATLNVPAGATLLALHDASFFADPLSPMWTLANAGTVISRGTNGVGFTSIDAVFNNSGTVRVELAGGTSQTLSLAGGGTQSGSLVLSAGTAVEFGNGTRLAAGTAITGEGRAVVAGAVVVSGGITAHHLTVAVGELNVGSQMVTLDGDAAQTGGTLRLGAGGILRLLAGPLAMDDGMLTGIGKLEGSLTAQGTVAPGAPLGTMQITGGATFGEAARLDLELGGSAAGSFDVLAVGGQALLGGEFRVTLAGGFVPSPNAIFSVLTAGGVSGVFLNAPLDGQRFATADGLGSFVIDYTPGTVVLTSFLPEPSAGVLAMLAGSVLLSMRRRAWRIR